ncbi:MAG: hypothetical protein EOP88_24095 [Verrucomicrobiaceae bacterium]|nr:MAG: hypothetical protein EOP88_24095 [Verrucomicrobiaceae bacterium]
MAEPAKITMEEIDREHREERARDAERLRRGEVTPMELQEENSFLPWGYEVRFVDFAASLRRAYAVDP